MEANIEEQPLKIRSVRAVVSTGFRLYMGNFRHIFRTTWLPAVICALVIALEYQFSLQAIAKMGQAPQALGSQDVMELLLQWSISLLNFLVTLPFVSYGFSMLTNHRQEGAIPHPSSWLTRPDWHVLLRTAASALVWFVAIVATSIISVGALIFGMVRQSYTYMGVGLLLMLVFAAFLLPLVYPNMRYLTTRDTLLFDLMGRGYRQGLRNWGYLFAVLFVVLLLTTIILSLTTLPAIVLFVANLKSQAGAAMGDPMGMPSYMGWLSYLVFALSGFIQCYVILAILFPAYYMAGSIEQQEIQKNEKTKNTLY